MRAGDSLSPSNVTLTIVAISNTLYQHGSARVLVGLLVFKTSAPVTSWWVGSIPMHFRHEQNQYVTRRSIQVYLASMA